MQQYRRSDLFRVTDSTKNKRIRLVGTCRKVPLVVHLKWKISPNHYISRSVFKTVNVNDLIAFERCMAIFKLHGYHFRLWNFLEDDVIPPIM